MAPDDDQHVDAPRADDGRTWLDIRQVSFSDARIILPDGQLAHEGGRWPARAERIEIDTVWKLNGKTTRETLASDLAFGRTDVGNPRFAYPFVTRDSGLTTRALDLERLILAAYSGAYHDEPDAEELAEHRATARAAADIALNGLDGWLTAVSRLVEERVLHCLPADVTPADGIRVLLHDQSIHGPRVSRPRRRWRRSRVVEENSDILRGRGRPTGSGAKKPTAPSRRTPKSGRDHAGDPNRLTLRTATSSRSPERRAANGRPGPGRARRRDPDPVTGPVRARQQRLTR